MKNNFYRIISLAIIITHLFTFCLRDVNFAHAVGVPVLPIQESTEASLVNSTDSAQINNAAGFNISAMQAIQNDPYTGRAVFSLPILVPAGRKDIQPNLALTYSSGSSNGLLGLGWSLDLGSIQRSTKRGIPKYNDTQDTFVLASGGSTQELVNIGSGEYRPKIEGSFSKITYDGTSWVLTDKTGTKLYFGSTTDSKQANPKGTFSWQLAKVVDIHGNFMTVEYTSDQGQLYPAKIRYTGNEVGNLMPAYIVEFILENRTDTSINYRPGAKVITARRLKQINVKYNDTTIRQYKIDYLPITNSRPFSFIDQIQIYNPDGTTALPPIKLEYNDAQPIFEQTPVYWDNVSNNGEDSPNWWGIRASAGGQYSLNDMLDVNADGLPDRIMRQLESPFYDYFNVQFNNGHGFDNPVQVALPVHTQRQSPTYYTEEWAGNYTITYTDLLDINADGLPDKVTTDDDSGHTKFKVWLNQGDSLSSTPVYWDNVSDNGVAGGHYWWGIRAYGSDYGRYFITDIRDFNADGLPDRIQRGQADDFDYRYWDVQFNNGHGFDDPVQIPTYSDGAPEEGMLYHIQGYVTKTDSFDINGDGLLDRVRIDLANPAQPRYKVWLNQGGSFDPTPVYWDNVSNNGSTDGTWWSSKSSNSGLVFLTDMRDINADGLPDRILRQPEAPFYDYWYIQLNNGHGFSDPVKVPLYTNTERESSLFYSESSGVTYTDFIDINGDGLYDRVLVDINNPAHDKFKVWLNKASAPDYLKKISNGIGGSVEITYKAYNGADNTTYDPQKLLPFPVWVVDTIIQKTGQEEAGRVSYSYDSGHFDSLGREFRGFGYARTIDAEGNYTENYFKQDNIYKGKLYKQEIKDKNNNLYTKIENLWGVKEIYPGVNFVYLSQVDSYTYDGDATFKQARARFEYDGYGNITKNISDGDLEVTGDEKTQVISYNYNTAQWLLSFPARSYITDSSGIELQMKNFVYDGQTDAYEPPVKGMVTLTEALNVMVATGRHIDRNVTLHSYDSFGNLVTVTENYDFNTGTGQTTTTRYDRLMAAYPIRVDNALNQLASYTGYYAIEESDFRGFGLPGQVEYTEDANYQRTYNIYDVLGRLVKVVGPLDSKDYPGIIYEYDLTVQPVKITKKVKADYNDPPTYYITYQFYDGLGRLIETKSPAQDEPQTGARRQIISDIIKFDSRGKDKEKYLSYFTASSPDYLTPTYATPKVSFIYDVLGRIVQTTNPDDTYQTISYSNWVTTITDADSHYKAAYHDAYGRIVKVEEYNGTQLYTTTYEYDVFGNLNKVIDNAGNITQNWYDAYGRKLKMVDPDRGEWSYKYDPLGNLKERIDAKEQVLKFNYDLLNRLTQKIHAPSIDESRTLATYIYDNRDLSGINSCLSQVDDSSGGATFFGYDKLGREIETNRSIDGNYYTIRRTYDALDRLISADYPNRLVVRYEYNPQGIEKVYSNNNEGMRREYVSNVEYSSTGQIIKIEYGNGNVTNYTYDPRRLRLTNLTTQSSAGRIQDLAYQFDNVGNIREIVDSVNTATQSFIYDDLGRLKTAAGSYGTLNYDYDSIGNMTLKDGQTVVYGQGGAGRLPHTATRIDGVAIDYDENGNMITKGSMVFSYDIENRITRAEDTSSIISERTVVIELRPGWNFFSLPVNPADSSISEVLSSISGRYDQLNRYNPATRRLQQYVGNPKYDQFNSIEYGKGYQIYITDPAGARLTVTGQLPRIGTTTLLRGYNLIFCPKVVETAVEQALLPLRLGTDYSSILRYNKDTAGFEEYSEAEKEFNFLKPGEAYYLYCLNTVTWNINNSGLGTTTFIYDADGARVKKTAPAGLTIYIGSLFEADSSGRYTDYIFAGSQRICSIDVLTGTEQGIIRYYHPDHLGSSNIITDKDGIQVSLSEFTPFGSAFNQSGTYESHYKFTGKELDSSTGLYFDGKHYYDPDLGAFITR